MFATIQFSYNYHQITLNIFIIVVIYTLLSFELGNHWTCIIKCYLLVYNESSKFYEGVVCVIRADALVLRKTGNGYHCKLVKHYKT